MTIIAFNDDSGDLVPVKAVNNGDGTYSISVGGATASGVQIAPGTYLGQQVITGNGANQSATLPTGTKGIWLTAEGGKVYGAINTTAAPTTAGIYVADGSFRYVGFYSTITSFGVYAASGVYAHMIYES